ncbi:ribosomal protein S18-alanine N-acetyltransferase [Nocardioides panacisoli]|uniref:ribosomal protein S18-alanine N-acetyltransferase n=1 Tax=Nocardioides panacisoli TaxID=627624 RepID=UPI001C627CA5|nr:ribosomal protein S18-alanine N-acetyltransferase [Nocardioides panacisoli]QYJ02582.1 ribosomal protein S18-alanine N-acetyltransferase [Nocardioides panacisoli]
MNLAVRAASGGDVEPVAALEEHAFPVSAWSRAMVTDGVAGGWPTTRFRVAEHEDGVVGYIAVSVVDDVAELQRIVVQPGDRRLGIGSALLEDAIGLAVPDGARRMLLEVREDNDQGRGFYDAQGFVEIARRPRYYRDGVTALVLERGLENDGDD